MSKKKTQQQSGGVNISGKVGKVGGSIVGHDQLNQVPFADLSAALGPLAVAIAAVPPEQQSEAKAQLLAIQQELAKGKHADDGILASRHYSPWGPAGCYRVLVSQPEAVGA